MDLPTTQQGNKHVVVFQNFFSKWPLVFPVVDQKTPTLVQLLTKEVIPLFGVPEALLSDRGTNLLPGPPIALQINCGFARVAIKELTPSNRSDLNESKQFCDLFCMSSYKLTQELFQLDSKGRQPFDRKCDMILDNLKSKWHPAAKRMEYVSTFSIQKWKSLFQAQQATHTLASCEGCYHAYISITHFLLLYQKMFLKLICAPKNLEQKSMKIVFKNESSHSTLVISSKKIFPCPC